MGFHLLESNNELVSLVYILSQNMVVVFYIYIYIHIYIYIYIVHMWQKSSVFFHESAQRNVAGHLIDKMSLKQHGHFATNGFVFPLIRQMLQNTQKSILNLWIVVNRKNANAFWIANQ